VISQLGWSLPRPLPTWGGDWGEDHPIHFAGPRAKLFEDVGVGIQLLA